MERVAEHQFVGRAPSTSRGSSVLTAPRVARARTRASPRRHGRGAGSPPRHEPGSRAWISNVGAFGAARAPLGCGRGSVAHGRWVAARPLGRPRLLGACGCWVASRLLGEPSTSVVLGSRRPGLGLRPPVRWSAAWAPGFRPCRRLFHRRHRRFGGAEDRKRDFGLDFAAAKKPHAVLGAAQDAGLDQGRGIDRVRPVEPAGIDRLLDAAEIHLVELAARTSCCLKPRLGRRRWSGIWPPSKPLMRTPERAVWPLPPRPPVLPLPEPMPRPMRFRVLRAPERPESSLKLHRLLHTLRVAPRKRARIPRAMTTLLRPFAQGARPSQSCLVSPACRRARRHGRSC